MSKIKFEDIFNGIEKYDDDSESDFEEEFNLKSKQTSKWFHLAYSDVIDLQAQVKVSDWFAPLVQAKRASMQQVEGPQEDAEELKRKLKRSQFFERVEVSGKRISVSHKKKYLDKMNSIIDYINTQIDIPLVEQYDKQERTDWITCVEKFDELVKTLQKFLKLSSVDSKKIPKFYIKFSVDFHERVIAFTGDSKYIRSLAKLQKKSCKSFLNKLRNHNQQYSKEVEEYLQDRENYDVDEDFGLEEEEQQLRRLEDGSETGSNADVKTPASKWELSDSDDDSEMDFKKKPKVSEKASRWLRDDYTSSDDEDVSKQKAQKQKKPSRKSGKSRVQKDKKGESVQVVLTPEMIDRKVEDARQRNKKLGKSDVIEELNTILSQMSTMSVKTAVKFKYQSIIATEIIAILAEKYTTFDAFMTSPEWKQCCLNLSSVLQIAENTNLVYKEFTANQVEETENDPNTVQIRGNFATYVETLDNEMIKALQYADPHSPEFVERLSQEYLILNLAERTLLYYQGEENPRNTARMAYRLLYHLHHRTPEDHISLLNEQKGLISGRNIPSEEIVKEDLDETINYLTTIIYQHGTVDLIERTVLLHSYFESHRNRYFKARNILLMSNDGKSINQKEVATQVLMNRAIAQLGLAAFRSGNLNEVNHILSDLCSNSRMKELLAQSITTKFNSSIEKGKRVEIEKKERSRLIPYHMHISNEVLEGVYLLSAMILEIPYIAINSLDKKKIISRPFRRLLDNYDRRVYHGPPESTKDFIYAAAVAMRKGDWKQSFDKVSQLSLWNHLSDAEPLKQIILKKIKEESLRTYLFSYSKYYHNISIGELQNRFELDNVQSLVSRMILEGDFIGLIDEPTQSIHMTQNDGNAKEHINPLKHLAWRLIERQSYFAEYNERYFKGPDAKHRFRQTGGRSRQ